MEPPFSPDLEAEIRFLTTEEGGRLAGVASGYRGQFHFDGQNWDALQVYPDVEWVNPGESARSLLYLLSPDAHLGRMHVGMEFEVREGARAVGRGRITKIMNLAESASRVRTNR